MIFPIRDDQSRTRAAYVNYFIIALNFAVFLYGFWLKLHDQPGWSAFTNSYTMVPHHFELAISGTGQYSISGVFLTIFTSMFMHAGWVHLIGNLWVLWIFGDNIEDHLGHAVYGVFYLLCGLMAGMAHIYANPGSEVPTLGASGAIAGVMGAFLLRYPEARVQIFAFYGLRAGMFWVAAWVVLALWFAIQLFSQVLTHWVFGNLQTGGVAYWAHLGGFLTGMVLIKVIPGCTTYSHGGWINKEGKELLPKQ